MALYPWLEPIYQQLVSAFEQGHGHHALLFKTESGLGTPTLIRQFATRLLCHTPQDAVSCGTCKSCLLMQSGNHPDFHFIESIEGKDIGVDQIRDQNTKLQQFAQQGGNSAIYIASAERLTEAAANALLKILEEPHDNVYFLLEAPLNSPLLATIQSRCQSWLVQPPSFSIVYQWLQEQCPALTLDDIEIALRLCHQRPLVCKDFLETDRLSQRKRFLQNFWRFYKSHDIWLLLSEFGKEKEDILRQLDWISYFFSDALKAKMTVQSTWINPDLRNGILPFSQALSVQSLLKGYQIILQTQQVIREVNAINLELMLADALTKLALDVFATNDH
ncbi:DNA polymerase III delta prime subunit [Nicoletella semolina]|uniref:DNA polymerase III subunit delta' n=1 Tax=Nicoletella semolina TaxID=271160 RepID=A0A4R2NB37_9PAST|nr:DNA polymerase III subunit delta' [Nicoletella semolina]MDH2924808.1 DNA polymerase III subunit delta' [Nicoletella semolina]TCP18341.1 DNA polymerase III delta prime subunit [Nicoletella semolina]